VKKEDIMKIKDLKEKVGISGFEVEGEVKNVYDRKSGIRDNHEWSFQDIVIDDGTGEIRVSLRNKAEFSKNNKGKWVRIQGYKDEQNNKMVGTTVVEEEYTGKNGKFYKVVKIAVMGKAEVEIIEKPVISFEKKGVEEKPVSGHYSEGEWFWRKNVVMAKENALTAVSEIMSSMIEAKIIKEKTIEEIMKMVKKEVSKIIRFTLKEILITKEEVEVLTKILKEKNISSEMWGAITTELFDIELAPNQLFKEEFNEVMEYITKPAE